LGELTGLKEPSNEPELAQSGIEFLNRLILLFPIVLLNQEPSSVEFLFMFTLKALTGNDPLPKQSAAVFWVWFKYHQGKKHADPFPRLALSAFLTKVLLFVS